MAGIFQGCKDAPGGRFCEAGCAGNIGKAGRAAAGQQVENRQSAPKGPYILQLFHAHDACFGKYAPLGGTKLDIA